MSADRKVTLIYIIPKYIKIKYQIIYYIILYRISYKYIILVPIFINKTLNK